MSSIFRNILAVISGAILGSIVNMSLIMTSSFIIPPPEGADVNTMEGLKASMYLFEPKHFIMPFLAHGLGTFTGAFTTYMIGVDYKMKLALVIGFFFLIGGITNVLMLPSPTWFVVLDLVGAYIPMAWLGGKLCGKLVSKA